MGRPARREKTGRSAVQLCLSRIATGSGKLRGERYRRRRARTGSGRHARRQTGNSPVATSRLSYRHRASRTRCARRTALRYPHRRGMGQHPLHRRARCLGRTDAGRLFRIARPTKPRFSRDDRPVSRPDARRRRPLPDIRYQPPAELLYEGSDRTIAREMQRTEDKRRGAGHCEPIVRLSGHRSAGHLPDADRAVRTPIPDPDARSERELRVPAARGSLVLRDAESGGRRHGGRRRLVHGRVLLGSAAR